MTKWRTIKVQEKVFDVIEDLRTSINGHERPKISHNQVIKEALGME